MRDQKAREKRDQAMLDKLHAIICSKGQAKSRSAQSAGEICAEVLSMLRPIYIYFNQSILLSVMH